MSRTPLSGAVSRADVVVAVWVSAFLALLGAPLGLLAAALTPHLPVAVVQDAGAGYPTPLFVSVAEENRAAFGGDGVVLAVLAAAGLLVGGLAVWRGRSVPGGTVVGLVLGGLVAGAVAMAVHHQVLAGTDVPLLSAGRTYELRPYARGSADLAVLPLVASLVWFVGQLPWLLRGGDDDERVSSGTAGSA